MRVFYDENGIVLGTASMTDKTVEAAMEMPGTTAIEAPSEVIAAINDPKDPTTAFDLEVVDGEVVIKDAPTESSNPVNT